MRDTLTSPRLEDMKRKRRARRRRMLILLAILFVVFVGALAYFSAHPRVTISTVVVSGTRIINPEDLEDTVRENLTGKYAYLFKKSNSLIYPRKRIYDTLSREYTRIENLSIYRDNLTTLHVAVTERSGSYLYCGAAVPELVSEIGENCYFINSDGYVFDKAPYFSGNVYFKYYMKIPEDESSNPLGKQMIAKERFYMLAQFIDGVSMLGLDPTYVVVDGEDTGTLYLDHADMATSPKIIFKNTDTVLSMLDNLRASMAKQEFANEIKSKYSTLLYIDLRFNNKVVYKFQ